MTTIQLEIKKDNLIWLDTIAFLTQKTKEELLEELINNKLEEIRNTGFTTLKLS